MAKEQQESVEAIELLLSLQITLANDRERLVKGQGAAVKRHERATALVLEAMIGRKPTQGEIDQATNW